MAGPDDEPPDPCDHRIRRRSRAKPPRECRRAALLALAAALLAGAARRLVSADDARQPPAEATARTGCVPSTVHSPTHGVRGVTGARAMTRRPSVVAGPATHRSSTRTHELRVVAHSSSAAQLKAAPSAVTPVQPAAAYASEEAVAPRALPAE